VVNTILQVGLALFGLTAIYLALYGSERGRFWSPIVGMCGQPFWLVFSLRTDAYGILVVDVAYAALYIGAIRRNLKAQRAAKKSLRDMTETDFDEALGT
jgi:hypothetical protein